MYYISSECIQFYKVQTNIVMVHIIVSFHVHINIYFIRKKSPLIIHAYCIFNKVR